MSYQGDNPWVPVTLFRIKWLQKEINCTGNKMKNVDVMNTYVANMDKQSSHYRPYWSFLSFLVPNIVKIWKFVVQSSSIFSWKLPHIRVNRRYPSHFFLLNCGNIIFLAF